MAYYPKERNVNGVFYYGAAGSDQVLETNSTFTYNATDNVLNVSATGATTAFFDNQASIASSDDTDLLLLLTGTTTSNPGYRKITKANFSAALGGGTMSSWDLDGDTGTAETVENAESVVIAGGTGLASVVNTTNTVTVNITGIQSDMIVDGSILNSDLAVSSFNLDGDTGTTQDVALGDTMAINGGTGISTVTNVGENITINISGIQSDMIVDGSISNADLANSDFTLQGDTGSNQTISLGDTMDIAGGAGIQTTASATDTLTVAVTGIDPSLLIGASITLDGDQGTTEEVNLGDTLFVGGGAGLQSTVTATDTVTIAVTGIQSDMIVDGSIANGDLANSTKRDRDWETIKLLVY